MQKLLTISQQKNIIAMDCVITVRLKEPLTNDFVNLRCFVQLGPDVHLILNHQIPLMITVQVMFDRL